MYKKCFKIDYRKDTQEKEMQEVVALLEKNNYICIHGVSIGEGGLNNKHHILVARKYKEDKPLTHQEIKELYIPQIKKERLKKEKEKKTK
jgi:hypothetical protein